MKERRPLIIALAVAFSSALLHAIAFPNFSISEAGFLFAIPLLIWLRRKKPATHVLFISWLAGFISWMAILIWLRHVTWFGTALLAGILALFWSLWFWIVSLVYPLVRDNKASLRLMSFFGLAGLWVVLEWVRTWLLTGFPWLPLAASQWNRPELLQILSLTGTAGLSFVLIFFNLAMSHYLPRMFIPEGKSLLHRLSPEFYTAFIGIGLTFSYGFHTGMYNRTEEPMFTAGFVQPYIPQDGKWDEEFARSILSILDENTHYAAQAGADLILWPESATPFPIIGEDYEFMGKWTFGLTQSVGVPILQGNMAVLPYDKWYNIVNIVTPQAGVEDKVFYSKRKLVPFGEYIPLQSLFPFTDPLVPFVSFSKGTGPVTIAVQGKNGTTYQAGPLVCYEDVFAHLARDQANAGADFLFVATNNAWYGEEAGAYQHAIHSVLRAVENRRPVLRSGNGGWSGWIDEYGIVRFMVADNESDIYIRSTATKPITRQTRFIDQQSVYARYGNWFVGLSGLMASGLFLFLRLPKRTLSK